MLINFSKVRVKTKKYEDIGLNNSGSIPIERPRSSRSIDVLQSRAGSKVKGTKDGGVLKSRLLVRQFRSF